MKYMFLITGLGNPGEKYKNTWHNMGFLALDAFAKENDFPEFELKKILKAEISEKEVNGEKVILAKPQTFMNLSGETVGLLIKHYKTKNLIVLHDDIDLPFGKLRIARNRGAAGHKGIESVVKVIKTKDFLRIRMGIQPEKKPKNAESFVLKKIIERDRLKE
ncbi:MAG: aminoacyl-tRNA hydrolase, partial [Candidatus Paceibacterota bacterium]